MDKVSIIIPIYNVEKYLSRCLDALINQTYQNIEIIAVDDKSPDNSREIIQEYAQRDSRIVPVLFEKNSGVSAARNAGIHAATGEWLCFCDGDDWFEPCFVEKMLSCAKVNQSDYVICDYQLVSEGKTPIRGGCVSNIPAGFTKEFIIACGPLSSCTHLIKKDLFTDHHIYYIEGCAHYEELSVIPALAFYAKKISIIDEPLYNYYQRGDGTSASNNTQSIHSDFLTVYKKLSSVLDGQYQAALEYHVIYALFYGEILTLCRHKKSSKQIHAYIHELRVEHPYFWKNKYVKYMGLAKRVFLVFVQLRLVLFLRLLAKLHDAVVG